MKSFNKRGSQLVVSLVLFLLAFSAVYFAYGSTFIPRHTGFDTEEYGGGGTKTTCYRCSQPNGMGISVQFEVDGGSCPAGSSTSQPTCVTNCYACTPGNTPTTSMVTDGDCSKLAPLIAGETWSYTPIDVCYPLCYGCNSFGVAVTPQRLASCSPPTWFSSQPSCGSKTCYKCAGSGQITTISNQASCTGDYSESEPSCPVACQRCNFNTGVLEKKSHEKTCPSGNGDPGFSAWGLTIEGVSPTSCPKLTTCYWCSPVAGSNPLVTLLNQNSPCQSPFTATQPTCLQTCFKCDASQTNGVAITHAEPCPSGYETTRPSNCGTCYSCDADGNEISRPLPAGTGSCSSFNSGTSGAPVWSSSKPSSCQKTCYACGASGILETTYAASCTGGTSETKPSSCQVKCQFCNRDATLGSTTITGLPTSSTDADNLCRNAGSRNQPQSYFAPTSCTVFCYSKHPATGAIGVISRNVAPGEPPCPGLLALYTGPT